MNNLTFQDLQLDARILSSLAAESFDQPTPIQAQAIPAILEGRDILASAQTGSGKTAAFVLPILELLAEERRRPERGRPRGLILAPTRELAGQIREVLSLFGRNLRLTNTVIYGGVGKHDQINALRRGVDIVVATPGRLLDLMGEGHLTLDRVKIIVIDEADRMLDMGFIPDVNRIIKRLPEVRQSLFFSATLPPAVVELAGEMLSDPVRVRVEDKERSEPRIDQHILFMERGQKRDALKMVLTENNSSKALVFTRTKHRARDLSRYLVKNGITSDDLHGDKSQNARNRALMNFHRGSIRVLVATDIASRGIDVDDIDHVINFELPGEAEIYTHRIGRTARAGKSGSAFSFCDESELSSLTTIQRVLNKTIPVFTEHPFHANELAEAAARLGQPRPARNSGQGKHRPSTGGRQRRRRPGNGFSGGQPNGRHNRARG